MNSLIVPENVEKYERVYRGGYNKKYPNLDLVRLDAWYFERKPGRVLDYGCGTGINMIHLLEAGHEVVGVDAASEAVNLVTERLRARPDLAARGRVMRVNPSDRGLSLESDSFDYVVCMSVLSLLESKDRIARLIAEFRRILVPGGKLIADINGPGSDFADKGRFVTEDTFEYTLHGDNDRVIRCYCPKTADAFATLFAAFVVDDVGHSSFKYQGQNSYEFIACVHKPG